METEQVMNCRLLALFVVALLLFACGGAPQKEPAVVDAVAIVPVFNADSAYSFVEAQVAFGPRVPNSDAHRACGDDDLFAVDSGNRGIIGLIGALRR